MLCCFRIGKLKSVIYVWLYKHYFVSDCNINNFTLFSFSIKNRDRMDSSGRKTPDSHGRKTPDHLSGRRTPDISGRGSGRATPDYHSGRKTPDPHSGRRTPDHFRSGRRTPEPMFHNPRVGALFNKWRQVWLMAMARQRKLQDAMDYLNEVSFLIEFLSLLSIWLYWLNFKWAMALSDHNALKKNFPAWIHTWSEQGNA